MEGYLILTHCDSLKALYKQLYMMEHGGKGNSCSGRALHLTPEGCLLITYLQLIRSLELG